MRLLVAAALVTTAGWLAADDDKKDPPKDAPKADARGETLKGMEKKFVADFEELLKRFQEAKTPAEKAAVRTEAKELATITVGKVAKFAAESPKDASALTAAEFALMRLAPLGAGGEDVDKLVGIVIDNHLGSPKIKDFVMNAGRMGATGEKLLKAAAEKATDKTVKGMALYFLGTALAEQADDAPNEKAAAELTAKALDYLEKAIKEAPDVRVGRQTIAAAAAGDIQALKTLGVGKPAPDAEGTELKDDKKVKLSSYQGKVVLLDIWATWCGPCRAMIPHERELVKKLAGKPFVLLSVSTDEKKETLTTFLEKEPMPWTHWWAGEESDLIKTYRVRAFPTLYLIDAKGVIRKKWVGSPDPEVLNKAVEELVKEVPASKG